ncbi:hypothetical protein [Lactobacillus helveticus]|uniref:hypothetical protein n=1 Tax=Lactobacillus helveticus TaxID=1587 RepID=UPI0015627AF4|nr:hypothetical protein [Lactobacillus helveticus]NRO89316.1 hypothetical protein [Lactobacillus helveticus]
MGQVRQPIAEENKRIGEISKHRRKIHRIVKNPLRGSLLERQMQRASYCILNKDKHISAWFEAETGMTPETFVDKWNKKLGN